MTGFSRSMMAALEKDGEMLRQITGEDHGPVFLDGCDYCDGEPEWVGPGWIDMPNNGGIKSCPMCNLRGANPRPAK